MGTSITSCEESKAVLTPEVVKFALLTCRRATAWFSVGIVGGTQVVELIYALSRAKSPIWNETSIGYVISTYGVGKGS